MLPDFLASAAPWWQNLLLDSHGPSMVAQGVLMIAIVSALGIMLGSVRIFGISLGIGGVLFSGLAVAHVLYKNNGGQPVVNDEVTHFVREFGLILFVYTVGLQVGPGIISSLKKAGLPLNMMAAVNVTMGAVIAVLIFWGTAKFGGTTIPKIEIPAAVGLFSGATTNTPSLAAAGQTLKEMNAPVVEKTAAAYKAQLAELQANNAPAEQIDALKKKIDNLPKISKSTVDTQSQAYAVAYPFGIVGIIAVMLLVRKIFKVDVAHENELAAKLNLKASKVETINLRLTNSDLVGKKLEDVEELHGGGVVASRVMQAGQTRVAHPEAVLAQGDVIHLVGPRERLENLKQVIGAEADVDLKVVSANDITAQRMVVTKKGVINKTIEELDFAGRYGVRITRVIRADVEVTATPNWKFQFGDSLMAVGNKDGIAEVGKEVGNSVKQLEHAQVVPIFIGMILGVVLGSIPIPIPGLSAPVKLGLAGGPLVVAIILSRIGQIGPLSWYMSRSANLMVRELGIVLFLACVGLRSGATFIDTLTKGDGLWWMAFAACITVIPLLVIALFARIFLKTNYTYICGTLAGSMTDPPALQFANQMTHGEGPSVAYATVYPLTMMLRIVYGQAIVLLFYVPELLIK